MESSSHVIARSRPVRIAFLIPLGEDSHPILDSVVDAAVSMWGGRFTLIVPCVGGEPMEAFRPWLDGFDPDVIYSYVDLTELQENDLHERHYPSELRSHSKDIDGHRYTPMLPFAPLSVHTVLPALGAGGRVANAGPAPIVELHPMVSSDPFLRQNFSSSMMFQNAIRRSLAPFGSPLVVVPEGAEVADLGRGARPTETISGAAALLNALARRPMAKSSAQIAAALCSRWSLPRRPWLSSFNLVIGDSVDDRLMFWNARFLFETWRDGDDADLYVPTARMKDPEFVEALANFLKRRNWVGDQHSSGHYRVTLRSITLSVDTMAPWATELTRLLTHQTVNTEQIASLEAFAKPGPNADHIARRWPVHGQEVFGNSPSLYLAPSPPEHLRFVPPELDSPLSGHWAIDLDIARTVGPSTYEPKLGRWRLPRRMRVTRTFCAPYHLQNNSVTLTPRVEATGLLTLFGASGAPLPTVSLPSDAAAIRIALTYGRDWTPLSRGAEPTLLRQLCHDARPSDAGQHFYGVFKLLGNVGVASDVLLHRFWRKQLDRFGATDQRSEHRHPQVLRRIEKRLGRKPLNLDDDAHRQELANLILLEADAERMVVPSIPWSDLVRDFQPTIDEYTPEGDSLAAAESREAYAAELRRCVERYCGAGILHQGYELRCRKCLHRNWISLDALAVTIPCHVCQRPVAAPLDQPWQFRLNGFLRESLQRHGIGPLFWVLNRFQRDHRGSFWFEGPLNI